jgi:hypothetical protein
MKESIARNLGEKEKSTSNLSERQIKGMILDMFFKEQ